MEDIYKVIAYAEADVLKTTSDAHVAANFIQAESCRLAYTASKGFLNETVPVEFAVTLLHVGNVLPRWDAVP